MSTWSSGMDMWFFRMEEFMLNATRVGLLTRKAKPVGKFM
jgi:hypothetical protein